MILRRLAQQLREQNWTAISIEFVLPILGVFLGIQVAKWNRSGNWLVFPAGGEANP